MADRIVYQIDVESPDFDKFTKQFDEYSAKLKETHESWKSIGDQINQVTDSFTKSSGLPKQAQETSKKLSPLAEMFNKMQNNVSGMTKAFDAWPKMLKPMQGLLGGGLIGLGAGLGFEAITQMFSQLVNMSAKIMDTGRAARGQGIGYGAYTAFKGLGKEVVSDPQAALNAVATARYDVASEQRRAFNVMFGRGAQKELQKGPEAIFDFMEQAQKRLKQYPEQVRATQAQALGLTSVAAFGDIMAYDPKQRAAQKKAQEEVAKHTDLTKDQQEAVTNFWRNFQTKMEDTGGMVNKFWADILTGALMPHRGKLNAKDIERNRSMGYGPHGALLNPDGTERTGWGVSIGSHYWGTGTKPAAPAPAHPATPTPLPATVGTPAPGAIAQAPAAPAGAAPTTRAPAGKPSWNPFHWGRSTPARPQQEQMAAPSMAIAGAQQSKVEESMSWVKSWFASETSATKAATRAAESRDRTLTSLMDDLKVFFEDKGSKLGTWASPAADNPAASTVGATGQALMILKYGAQAARIGGPAVAGLGIAATPGLTGPLTPGGMKGAIALDDAERKKFYDFIGSIKDWWGGKKPPDIAPQQNASLTREGIRVASLDGGIDADVVKKWTDTTKENTDALKKLTDNVGDSSTIGKDWAAGRYGGGTGASTGGGGGGGPGMAVGSAGRDATGVVGGGGGGIAMDGLGGLPGFGGGGGAGPMMPTGGAGGTFPGVVGGGKPVFPQVRGGALMGEIQRGAARTPGAAPTDIRVGTQGPGAAQPAVSGTGKAAAEAYLGKPISNTEYDQLVRATSAESGGKNSPEEQAMIMGTILNRARTNKGGITGALTAPKQFQSVTGTAYQPGPSRNFTQGPNETRRASIENAAGMLGRVPTNQVNFTAASRAAYGPGTNVGYLDQLQRTGGAVYGGTQFGGHLLPADQAKALNITGGGGSSGGGGASGDWAAGGPAVKPPGGGGGGMTGGEQTQALSGIPNADALLADVKAKNPHLSNEQCVTLVHSYANMGGKTVRDWRRGENIMSSKEDITIGTPMATFMGRRGEQSDKYDAGEGVGLPVREARAMGLPGGTTHAALFGGYTYDEKGNRTGFKAVEQYSGSKPHIATYRQGGGFGERGAENYEVINTAAGQPWMQPKQQPQQTAMAQPARPATPTPQKPGPLAMDHWQSPDRGPSVKIHNQTGSDVFINSSILASA